MSTDAGLPIDDRDIDVDRTVHAITDEWVRWDEFVTLVSHCCPGCGHPTFGQDQEQACDSCAPQAKSSLTFGSYLGQRYLAAHAECCNCEWDQFGYFPDPDAVSDLLSDHVDD